MCSCLLLHTLGEIRAIASDGTAVYPRGCPRAARKRILFTTGESVGLAGARAVGVK